MIKIYCEMKSKLVKAKRYKKITPANQYPPFSEWIWRSYSQNTRTSLEEFIKSVKDRNLYVGTDSQNYKDNTRYTTVVIGHKSDKGGRILIHHDRTQPPISLKHRLFMETMRSLEAAFFVSKLILSKSLIALHLDINPSPKWESGKYKDELIGMVIAQGFKVECKPLAWASSTVADRKT